MPAETQIGIQILATSDLHMHTTAFDFVADRPTEGNSFARVASVIAELRAKAEATGDITLLLDNGDTLQGTPMADFLAKNTHDMPNPMAAIFNKLAFDAVGLGNHDFDHGLDCLHDWLSQYRVPITCANLTCDRLPMIAPTLILERSARALDGSSHNVRIGVVSVLPQKTALWNRHNLENHAKISHPLPVLEDSVARLRAEGADIVIVLAHMGIALFDEGDDPQNQIETVAKVSGVDAIIGGHTHLCFPGEDHADVTGLDHDAGLISGVPVVLPGTAGSDLGAIDLRLTRKKGGSGWQVSHGSGHLVSVDNTVAEDAVISDLCGTALEATRHYLSEPITNLDTALNTFFVLASPSPITSLLARAKQHAIRRLIAGSALENLPLLAAASSPATGGLNGPTNFISVARGSFQRRHVAGVTPYANHVWAVKVNGARLLDWLERSALIFNTLTSDAPDQLLVNPLVPGFRFDTIYGLSYQIDPTQAPRLDQAGRVNPHSPGRIKNVMYQDQPLDLEQTFIVATSDHRVSGGGAYHSFDDADIIARGTAPVDAALINFLQCPGCDVTQNTKPWSFVPAPGVCAILETAPEAAHVLDDISHLSPELCGLNARGFLKVRLFL